MVDISRTCPKHGTPLKPVCGTLSGVAYCERCALESEPPKVAHPIVKLKHHTHFGATRLYPHNATAEVFCEMLARKTFSDEMIEWVKRLGFTVEIT